MTSGVLNACMDSWILLFWELWWPLLEQEASDGVVGTDIGHGNERNGGCWRNALRALTKYWLSASGGLPGVLDSGVGSGRTGVGAPDIAYGDEGMEERCWGRAGQALWKYWQSMCRVLPGLLGTRVTSDKTEELCPSYSLGYDLELISY